MKTGQILFPHLEVSGSWLCLELLGKPERQDPVADRTLLVVVPIGSEFVGLRPASNWR